MSSKKQQSNDDVTAESASPEVKKKCFVIMPIANQPGYEDGHFERVYDEIIKPAVLKAGFEPRRADDVKATHVIILEILKNITEFDMAICDLSSLNPNVLYELGIRQMAQKPVVLIKDKLTRRIFDIGLLSDIEYDSSLRVDTVRNAIEKISIALKSTYENKDDTKNSLVDLLSVKIKVSTEDLTISPETKLMMDKIDQLMFTVGRQSSRKKWDQNDLIRSDIFTAFEEIRIGDYLLIDGSSRKRLGIDCTLVYVVNKNSENRLMEILLSENGEWRTLNASSVKFRVIDETHAMVLFREEYERLKNFIFLFENKGF